MGQMCFVFFVFFSNFLDLWIKMSGIGLCYSKLKFCIKAQCKFNNNLSSVLCYEKHKLMHRERQKKQRDDYKSIWFLFLSSVYSLRASSRNFSAVSYSSSSLHVFTATSIPFAPGYSHNITIIIPPVFTMLVWLGYTVVVRFYTV